MFKSIFIVIFSNVHSRKLHSKISLYLPHEYMTNLGPSFAAGEHRKTPTKVLLEGDTQYLFKLFGDHGSINVPFCGKSGTKIKHLNKCAIITFYL